MNNSQKIKTKICSKCQTQKAHVDFYKKRDGYDSRCKLCVSKYKKMKYINPHSKEKRQELHLKNKERNNNYCKQYYQKNKSKIKIKHALYKRLNRPLINSRNKKRLKERRISDLNFKLKEILRRRINYVIKNNNVIKCERTLELLGCSLDELKLHLESQFKKGMTWKNHTQKGWHIDHIKPCASFDLTNNEQQKQCFHYTNLQPLWWYENLSKGDTIN